MIWVGTVYQVAPKYGSIIFYVYTVLCINLQIINTKRFEKEPAGLLQSSFLHPFGASHFFFLSLSLFWRVKFPFLVHRLLWWNSRQSETYSHHQDSAIRSSRVFLMASTWRAGLIYISSDRFRSNGYMDGREREKSVSACWITAARRHSGVGSIWFVQTQCELCWPYLLFRRSSLNPTHAEPFVLYIEKEYKVRRGRVLLYENRAKMMPHGWFTLMQQQPVFVISRVLLLPKSWLNLRCFLYGGAAACHQYEMRWFPFI